MVEPEQAMYLMVEHTTSPPFDHYQHKLNLAHMQLVTHTPNHS